MLVPSLNKQLTAIWSFMSFVKSHFYLLSFLKKECVECDLHKAPTDIVIIEAVWYHHLKTIVLAPELYAQYHCL